MSKKALVLKKFQHNKLNAEASVTVVGGGEARSDRRTGSCAYSRKHGVTTDYCIDDNGDVVHSRPTGCRNADSGS